MERDKLDMAPDRTKKRRDKKKRKMFNLFLSFSFSMFISC